MPDSNVVAAKMTVDIVDFKAGMADLTASAKASLDQIVSQLTNLSSASASSTSQIVQNLKNLTSSSNYTGSAIRQMGQQSAAAIQQMSTQYQASMAQINTAMRGIAQSNNALLSSLNINIQRTREELIQAISSLSSTVPVLGGAAAAQHTHANAVNVNSTAIREFLVIMREASRGDVTRMAGSLSILAQQFDLTRKIIESIFTPLGALTAIFIAFNYIKNQSAKSLKEVSNALELSGNMAGLTDKSFVDLTQNVVKFANVSNAQARTALLEVTKAGFLTKTGIEDLSEAAILLGRKTGEGTEEALKYLLKMKNGATKAAQEMVRDGYDLLSAAQIEEIRHLDNVGEHLKAQELLAKDAKESLEKMSGSTTQLSRDLQNLGNWLSDTTGKFVRFITDTQNATEKTKSLTDQIEAIKNSQKSGFGNIFGDKDRLASLEKELSDSIKSEKAKNDAAKKSSEERRKNREIIEDDEWATRYKKNDQRLAEELQRAKKYEVEKNLTKQQSYELEESIRKRYEFKPRKERGAETQSQIVRGELLDYLVMQEHAAIDQGKIYTKRLQDTVKFYEDEASVIRSRKGATKSDIMRVDNQLLSAQLAVDKEKQTASIAAMQDEIKDRSKGYDEQIRLAKAFETKLFDATAKPDNSKKGEFNQSKQYYGAQKERKTLEERGLQESLQIQQEEYKGFATIELEKLDDLKASYKLQFTEHQINLRAYLALMRQEASDELKIKEKLIDDEIALERQKDGGGDPVKLKQLENQKLLVARQSNKEIIRNSQDAAKDYMKPWDDAWKHMSDAFSSNIEKVIKKQQNLGQAFRYTLGDMVLYGAKESEKIAINWIKDRMHELIFGKAIETKKTIATGVQTQARIGIQTAETAHGIGLKGAELPVHFGVEQEKTGATVMGEEERVAAQEAGAAEGLAIKAAMAIKQIAIDAYTAFAGAYAAIAAIPYVGPVLAPIAAGVAFAGVIAAGRAIASAEGGYDIPHGVNPVTQLHQDEMVLPAPVANTVRSAMNGSTNAAKRSGGNTHIHMSIHTPNADSFRKSATQIQRETKRKMAMI